MSPSAALSKPAEGGEGRLEHLSIRRVRIGQKRHRAPLQLIGEGAMSKPIEDLDQTPVHVGFGQGDVRTAKQRVDRVNLEPLWILENLGKLSAVSNATAVLGRPRSTATDDERRWRVGISPLTRPRA